MNKADNFMELMKTGGPLMWAIFAAAAAALAMIAWEAMKTAVLLKKAEKDFHGIEADKGFLPGIGKKRASSPVAEILSRTNWKALGDAKTAADEISRRYAEIAPRLEGWLPTVAILGSLLPMLGLLGTVTGMITVFEVLAVNGAGRPENMALGISQALLTTAGGLATAIPVIFLHHALSQNVKRLAALTSQSLQALLARDFGGPLTETEGRRQA